MRYEVSSFDNFNEAKYLSANPDVLKAINHNELKTGREHFEAIGCSEKRYQKISLEKYSPLAVVHVPKCAGTSLRREIDQISSNMYNGRKYSLQKSKLNFFQVIKSKYTGSEITSTTWSPKELRKAHNEYDCVMGHIRLRDFKDAGFKDFVIIVREPRVRILFVLPATIPDRGAENTPLLYPAPTIELLAALVLPAPAPMKDRCTPT